MEVLKGVRVPLPVLETRVQSLLACDCGGFKRFCSRSQSTCQLNGVAFSISRSTLMTISGASGFACSRKRLLGEARCMHCHRGSSSMQLATAHPSSNALWQAVSDVHPQRKMVKRSGVWMVDNMVTFVRATLMEGRGGGGGGGDRGREMVDQSSICSVEDTGAPACGLSEIEATLIEGRGGGGGDGGYSPPRDAQKLIKDAPLLHALNGLACNDNAPFHFPGHKGGMGSPCGFVAAMGMSMLQHDLPELPELDNLFAPEGVIKDAQVKAARVFGADATWFLVNGSTCGLQAAVLATCHPGDCLVLPRNAHQSAFSAMVLSGAVPQYIVPGYDAHWDVSMGVSAEEVETALVEAIENDKLSIGAVLIVSPTYEGICSDVGVIANVCRRYGVPLIVDEAHGGHFAFHSALPTPALLSGADISVQSTHKVLSSLTQSAMLHVKGKRVSWERISKALQVVQSSSPSYLLLSSLDATRVQMTCELDGKGVSDSPLLAKALNLARFCRHTLKQVPGLEVLEKTSLMVTYKVVADLDPLRITVHVRGLGLSGFEVDDILREEYGVVAELPTFKTLTFAVSAGTTDSHVQSLINAFNELSNCYSGHSDAERNADRKLAVDCDSREKLTEHHASFEEFQGTLQDRIGHAGGCQIPGFNLLSPNGGNFIAAAAAAASERELNHWHESANSTDCNEEHVSVSGIHTSAVGNILSGYHSVAATDGRIKCSVDVQKVSSGLSAANVLGEEEEGDDPGGEGESKAGGGSRMLSAFGTPLALSPREAFFAPSERVRLEDAVGRICVELLAPYPPGIPVLAPGEVITQDALDYLNEVVSSGGSVSGTCEAGFQTIAVVSYGESVSSDVCQASKL